MSNDARSQHAQNENVRSLQNSTADLPTNSVSRRRALEGLGIVGASSFLFGDSGVFANEADESDLINQTASEHARPESLPEEIFKLPRWIPEKAGNFDLTNVHDNHFAFAKAQANLAGEITWFTQYGWALICPPGKPAYPFLGRMKVAMIFVTHTDPTVAADVTEDAYTVWLTSTEAFFDPRSFEPVSKILNPYTGKMMDVPILNYADRIVFRPGNQYIVPGIDPHFYTQQWDADSGFSQHYIDTGDEITYTFLGSSQFDGPHQPRCDVGFWTVNKDELMDQNLRSIDCWRDYSIIQKMTEFDWWGAPEGDQAQIFAHTKGIKTQDLNRVPKLIKRGILDRLPERFTV